MDKDEIEYIKNVVIPKFLEINNTLNIGEFILLSADNYLLKFELDNNYYALLITEYIIESEIFSLTKRLADKGIKVRRILPLVEDNNLFIYKVNRKVLPHTYRKIFDDRYVCIRI